MDPRPSVISARLSGIGGIIAVTGWKGGIGKSVTASTLALLLADRGFKTGLLDLDFAGASAHVALGADGVFPKEEKGLEPPEVAGVRLMSVSFFSGKKAVPLRGANVSDAIIELLAITQWGKLDFLIIDMPPGINDAALDLIRLIPRAKVLAVTTPSVMAHSVLERSLALYKRLKVPALGVIENMTPPPGQAAKAPGAAGPAFGGRPGGGAGRLIGSIRFDPGLEEALGRPDKLLKTAFARDLGKIMERYFKKPDNYSGSRIKLSGI
ncbi:MAG: P-loop NTPase [Elusimicrobia bacterium]|nr:P-loop NTPase [Elusimicrobiota bacterium]